MQSLAAEERTMIFYEAPHKLSATLGDLQDVFGADRRISLCRELTKLHEEVRRTTLGEAVDYYLVPTRLRANSCWWWKAHPTKRRSR